MGNPVECDQLKKSSPSLYFVTDFAMKTKLAGFHSALLLGLLLACPETIQARSNTDFPTWLDGVRHEAKEQGISPTTIQLALDDLKPLEQVIELDRQQLKGRRASIDSYLKRVLPPKKIDRAVRFYQDNRPLLEQIEKDYQVPGHYLVALWGVESDFGGNQGKTPVVSALATLAYDGRRSEFFRGELFNALTILDHGHIPHRQMNGSWAGAMGQVQFMPSTFLQYAVDFDNDGRKDIWTNRADALASAANYLKSIGWKQEYGWGEKVTLPRRFDTRLAGLDTRKTLKEWRRLGVRDVDGPGHVSASLILPDGPAQQAFLAYDNYRVLLNWNRSTSFALKVGHLAHRIYAAKLKK